MGMAPGPGGARACINARAQAERRRDRHINFEGCPTMVQYKRYFLRGLLIASIPLLVLATDTGAATKQWVGTSGNWTTAPNWSPAGMPQDFDNVYMRTFDTTNHVVTYNVNDGLLHYYDNMLVQSPGIGGVEFRPFGHDLELNTLTLSGSASGSALYSSVDSSTFVNTATMGFNGFLHLNAGSLFRATNFTQNSGYVAISVGSILEVDGTYMLNGGFVEGPGLVRSHGTAVVKADFGGMLENRGTLIFDSPSDDFDFGGLDNSGTLVFNTNAPGIGRIQFADRVINRVSNTLPANKSIHLKRDFAHLGGTFTQLGWVEDEVLGNRNSNLSVTGTWIQATDELTGTNMATISIGGTYLLNSGPLLTGALHIGLQSDGSIVQNGGTAGAYTLNLSASPLVNTRRGHYNSMPELWAAE